MNLRLILPAMASILLAASCTPYVEPPPDAPTDPAARKPMTEEEKAKLKEEREKKKKEEEADKTPDKDKKPEGDVEGGTETKQTVDPKGDGAGTPAEKKPEIQVARPVPGKPGFVFSPFNNKIIDVKGIPSGRLVADPTYPASEKKHFRVP